MKPVFSLIPFAGQLPDGVARLAGQLRVWEALGHLGQSRAVEIDHPRDLAGRVVGEVADQVGTPLTRADHRHSDHRRLPPEAETHENQRAQDRPPPDDRLHLGLAEQLRGVALGHRNLHRAEAELDRSKVEVGLQLVLVEPRLSEIQLGILEHAAVNGSKPVRRLGDPAPGDQGEDPGRALCSSLAREVPVQARFCRCLSSYGSVVLDHGRVARSQSFSMKICAFDEKTRKLVEVIASQDKPMLTRIPGHYLHGTKAISDDPSVTIYFTTKLYDYSNPDEERLPWNESAIVPSEINGNKNDVRVNQPWDWFYPPYR